MLQARIGRFTTGERKVLRAGAVFGQTFWVGGVAALLEHAKTAAEIDGWLSALVDAEMIEPHAESGLAHEKEYGFRHALVRDAVYTLLTKSDLVTGHRLAGTFLELAGERNEAVIAEHYERGDEKPQAAALYSRAAERAWGNFANESALRWVAGGLRCGAQGELLGTLRSLASSSCFLQGRFDQCYFMALEAIPLLRPGSLTWTRAISSASLGSVFGPPEWRSQFPELVEKLLAADPEPDAEADYAEAVSHTVASLSLVVPGSQIQRALNRLEAICEHAAARNPTIRRHFHLGRGRYLRMSSAAPWQQAQAATRDATPDPAARRRHP